VISLQAYVIVCLIGLVSGGLQALLGIGGGAVIVPALVFLAHLSQKQAQAMSLWYVVPTSLIAGILYVTHAEVPVQFTYVAAMVAAAFVGALIGIPLVKRVHQNALKQVFGIAVILIAGIMVWRALAGNLVGDGQSQNVQYLIVTWIGLAAGFLGSLLGIGGGVIVVPLLVLAAGFDQRVAQGMSLLYVAPAALFSAVLYRFHAKITIEAGKAALMMSGGVVGACVGEQLMIRLPEATLRVIFAAVLAALGIIMIMRAHRARGAQQVPDWVI
jgi:uncharacterized membrane protein YfcA